MKTLILGAGAFGFAIAKHLGENNPGKIFDIFDINKEVLEHLKKTREHPYFFKGYILPENSNIVDGLDDYKKYELIIIAIPAQFVGKFASDLKEKISSGVTILNLAKGIDNKQLKTISEILQDALGDFPYQYAVLSGGMIALDVVEGLPVGADIGIENMHIGRQLQQLFENENLTITLKTDYKNIELYGSLKNVLAILLGYYDGKGYRKSSLGRLLIEFLEELKELLTLFGTNKEINVVSYSLGADIIASCFGDGRNNYFGKLVGKGMDVEKALEKLQKENKHAEGYETLKALYPLVKDKEGFLLTKKLARIFLHE